MRAAPVSVRFAWGAVFALLLAMRSLAPAGFMPSFEHGTVAIVACPDATPVTPTHMHGHGDHKNSHQPCAYAAAASLGTVAAESTPLLPLAAFAIVALLGAPLIFPERRSRRDRPPSRGPPLPA